jgi:hypothetical protein
MGVDLKKNTTGSDSVKKPSRVEDFVEDRFHKQCPNAGPIG